MTKREAKEILTNAVMRGNIIIDTGLLDDTSVKEALLIAIVSLTDNESEE